MKKRLRRRPPDEIKVVIDKKRDDMENEKKSDELRKIWLRKPYEGCNGKV